MKDKKARYLIINATDIYKETYNRKDSRYNKDIPYKITSAKQIFDKYNIPEEYQKIIVKINLPFFLKYEAQEYTMGFPFDITGGKIEKKNNIKYISASNYPISYDNQVFRNEIKYKTKLKYYKFNEVIDFLGQIDDGCYLQLYLKSIKDFFDITIDLDYVYEVWNQEKNKKKALKLYRKKYPHK